MNLTNVNLNKLALTILLLCPFILLAGSSNYFSSTACDATIVTSDADMPQENGSITTIVPGTASSYNVLIWTPSGDLQALETSPNVWFRDGLPANPELMTIVIAYDSNGNEICEEHYMSPIEDADESCPLKVSIESENSLCSGSATLTANVHDESTCEECVISGNNTYFLTLDIWESNPGGLICADEFTSNAAPGYDDTVDFIDPIGDSTEEIASIQLSFGIAACDYENSQNPMYVDNIAVAYPLELNGYEIGSFDPTELPCTYDVCDPNGTVSFDIDPAALPYIFNGTNTLDLNFSTATQDICLAYIDMEIHTVTYTCSETNEVDYVWNTGESVPEIEVTQGGIYCLTVTDCNGCVTINCTNVLEPEVISGIVFLDEDQDNCQSEGDGVLENVSVHLYHCESDSEPAGPGQGVLIASTETDENGIYGFFCETQYDNYYIEIELPSGYTAVEQDDCGDEAIDSDGNMAGQSDCTSGSAVIDFGLKAIGSISGHMARIESLIDDDGNLILVNTNQAGVELILLDASENIIANTATQEDGTYMFEEIPAGIYNVVSPSCSNNCIDVIDEDQSVDALDPDGASDPIDNRIPVILLPGEADTDNNFVDKAYGTISGSVMIDQDNDDIGDDPLASVVLELKDMNGDEATDIFGNPVVNRITDNTGYYIFDHLYPGDYVVHQTQPADYISVVEEDMSDDDVVDSSDTNLNDDKINVQLVSGENDSENNFVEEDVCANYIMSEPNTMVTMGVVANPDIIGSENDIVNVTFVLVNLSEEPMTNVNLVPEVSLFSGDPYSISLDPVFGGDPNNNGQLDPGEIWFYSAVNSYDYNQGDVLIISSGVSTETTCGMELGAAADLLFTSGVNMDVNLEQKEVSEGDDIDITLTTRLLINEDVAANPGVKIVNIESTEIPVPLPHSRWEGRDLEITISGVNNNQPFDPFDPPAELRFVALCDQGGLDAGRTTNHVLDELESIETLRAPCANSDVDDDLCQFPDWVFCYTMTAPEVEQVTELTISASDKFSLWKSDEISAGSGEFSPFVDISEISESGGYDQETITVRPRQDNNGSHIQMHIYPNPVMDRMMIETNLAEQGVIKIFDILGRKVLERKIDQKMVFDVSTLSTGQYNVVLSDSNKIEHTVEKISVLKR